MPTGADDGSPTFPPPARLLDQVRHRIRFLHYSIRTEQAYVDWIKRFIRFHGKAHPLTLGAPAVELFLTNLAVVHNVSAATQNQAQSALLFLYKEVLRVELPWLDEVQRAKKPRRLPVVLTREEVVDVLNKLQGVHGLIGRLLYGTGMRILEALRLRVKDVEFERRAIVVRDGKGGKDRVTMLPASLLSPLRERLLRVARLHQADLARGYEASICRTRLRSNIRPPRGNGGGNMSSPRRRSRAIPEAARCVATI